MNLELHPLCSFFPRLNESDFNVLKRDIEENGQIQPITLLNGMILDGGNRYRAIVELGIEPIFHEYTGENPVKYVLSANLHRRHLTQGQAAVIVSAMQDWSRANLHGGDRKSENQSAMLHLDSVEKRADESGVSIRTQKDADKLSKNAPPEVIKQVTTGQKSLNKALVESGLKEPKKPLEDEQPSLMGIIEDLSDLNKSLKTDNDRLEKIVNSEDSNAELLKQIVVLNATNAALNSRLNGMNTERTAMIGRIRWLEKQLKKHQAEIKPDNADDPW